MLPTTKGRVSVRAGKAQLMKERPNVGAINGGVAFAPVGVSQAQLRFGTLDEPDKMRSTPNLWLRFG